jgi:signal transduction histidine kinase
MSETKRGTGLGLAIVKTCIETCGGRVTAHNLDPQGLAVVIDLKSASHT